MSACQDRIWASQAMKTALLPIKKDKPKFSFVKDDFQTICLDEPICTNCTPENFHYSTRSGFELDLTISAELRSTPSIITASHKEETKISRYYSTSNYYQSKLAVAKPLIYDCSTNYIPWTKNYSERYAQSFSQKSISDPFYPTTEFCKFGWGPMFKTKYANEKQKQSDNEERRLQFMSITPEDSFFDLNLSIKNPYMEKNEELLKLSKEHIIQAIDRAMEEEKEPAPPITVFILWEMYNGRPPKLNKPEKLTLRDPVETINHTLVRVLKKLSNHNKTNPLKVNCRAEASHHNDQGQLSGQIIIPWNTQECASEYSKTQHSKITKFLKNLFGRKSASEINDANTKIDDQPNFRNIGMEGSSFSSGPFIQISLGKDPSQREQNAVPGTHSDSDQSTTISKSNSGNSSTNNNAEEDQPQDITPSSLKTADRLDANIPSALSTNSPDNNDNNKADSDPETIIRSTITQNEYNTMMEADPIMTAGTGFTVRRSNLSDIEKGSRNIDENVVDGYISMRLKESDCQGIEYIPIQFMAPLAEYDRAKQRAFHRVDEDGAVEYQVIQQMMTNAIAKNPKTILLTICQGAHYYLAHLDVQNSEIQIMDSIGYDEERIKQLRKAITTILTSVEVEIGTRRWKLFILNNLPKQSNFYDCGLHVMHNVESVYLHSENIVPRLTADDMLVFRAKVVNRFETYRQNLLRTATIIDVGPIIAHETITKVHATWTTSNPPILASRIDLEVQNLEFVLSSKKLLISPSPTSHAPENWPHEKTEELMTIPRTNVFTNKDDIYFTKDHLDSVKNEDILPDDVLEAYIRTILRSRKNQFMLLSTQFMRRNGYVKINGSNITDGNGYRISKFEVEDEELLPVTTPFIVTTVSLESTSVLVIFLILHQQEC
ncbi:Ubiquitin-like-specific protease 1A [Folsomia candida]|uniref:Ubiquitin-like-specific protease 1A n=1 Tax=Folsomia candida TaxID=158441 RepID=A0A226CWN3_FOLCA|nr:Ubiquitin-like-specific protease 1A [Folsomia candida]